MTRAAQTYFNC